MNSELLFGVYDADGDLLTLVGATEDVPGAMQFFGIRKARITKSRFQFTVDEHGERRYDEVVDLDSFEVG